MAARIILKGDGYPDQLVTEILHSTPNVLVEDMDSSLLLAGNTKNKKYITSTNCGHLTHKLKSIIPTDTKKRNREEIIPRNEQYIPT
ncbi:hypothetical protein WA026_008207 [Henosepilachna vigintioctopunctata]|uniref:Uncharacterized protein n=1 Tax=Henosepilachna vigintioctopunctata TaxID=420089 RepID=A0AAW1TSA1_9CUCU